MDNYTSLADAKLERQRQRNAAADPLTAPPPPPLDRRQGSRNKGAKAWKPFDFTADNESGGMPAEVRINTFRPESRTSSSARSQYPSDHDGGLGDGFQLFTGRKSRRAGPSELVTHDTRPEMRQQTVEATPNLREILEVFGTQLPGPQFLEQNAGYKSGLVQFLQHPNGDVSAQQWSAERFEWVNLGQFSNIRKKVEGQLASDRLKGETSYQTLQQGTLQYFRIIAKQREAIAMGIEFGPKQIREAMPEPAMRDSTPPDSKIAANRPPRSPPVAEIRRAAESGPPANAPREPLADRWEVTGPRDSVTQPDPFVSTSSASTVRDPAAYAQYPAYYHASSISTTGTAMQSPGAQRYFAERAALANKIQAHWNQVYSPSAYRNPNIPNAHDGQYGIADPALAPRWEPEIAHPKPVQSLNRTAMRDQLIKLGENAKERSLSNSNIRTVLHDPFQLPATPVKTEAAKSSIPSRDSAIPRKLDILQQSSPDTQWTKRPFEHTTPLLAQSTAKTAAPDHQQHLSAAKPDVDARKTYEDELDSWWTGGDRFARHEAIYEDIRKSAADSSVPFSEVNTRLMIPALENLAAYVTGPLEKRRDYWCQWVEAPEWCIDRSEHGNDSFFEANWGSPPQRIGRDPRYAGSFGSSGGGSARKASRGDGVGHVGMGVVGGSGAAGWQGVDRRFTQGMRY